MRNENKEGKSNFTPSFTCPPNKFLLCVHYWVTALSCQKPASDGTPALLVCCFAQLNCGVWGSRTLPQSEEFPMAA